MPGALGVPANMAASLGGWRVADSVDDAMARCVDTRECDAAGGCCGRTSSPAMRAMAKRKKREGKCGGGRERIETRR